MYRRKSGGVRTELQGGKRSQEGDEGLVRETRSLESGGRNGEGSGQQCSQRAADDCTGARALPPQPVPTSAGRDHALQLLGEGTGAGASLAEEVGFQRCERGA